MQIGFFYAIVAAITWGLVYAIDQRILYHPTPLTLLFLHSAVATVLLLPFVLFSTSSSNSEILSIGKLTIGLIILSILLAALADFFILSSIKSSGASIASMIEISYPFFVVFFSYVLFRTVPNIYFSSADSSSSLVHSLS